MNRPARRLAMRAHADWYRITNVNGQAEVMIYDEIGYWGVTADDFARELKAVDATEITLRINSPGGDVFDGVAIHNAVRNHPATVNVIVDGLAASAASFIAMAGDHITMGRGTQMMIHEARGLCIGEAKDMRALADNLDRIGDTIAGFYAERAGGEIAQWREAMRAETWYTGEEAVNAGLANAFDDPPKAKAQTQDRSSTWDLSMFRYEGRLNAPAPNTTPNEQDEPSGAFDLAIFRAAYGAALKED